MSDFRFAVEAQQPGGEARAGRIQTRRGEIETPIFMPVGTVGSVKTVTPTEVRASGAQIILGNTYHLYLRPTTEVLDAVGGLHKFMGWDGPILTDSGGFQFFSLSELAKFSERGVVFRSHLDGSKHEFTPERVIEIQRSIGSDIMMVLDHCMALPASQRDLEAAMHTTTRWARRSLDAVRPGDGALFAILQGGTDATLRRQHVEELCGDAFDGFAVGGLAVGEEPQEMYDTLEAIAPTMPADKPRYLMGVGKPIDLLQAIERGVDMFDCVMPTRNARTGQVFTRSGVLNMRNAVHKLDDQPIDAVCSCPTCTGFSRAYVRHLIKSGELLGIRLTTLHNLQYYLDLVGGARAAIVAGQFDVFKRTTIAAWQR